MAGKKNGAFPIADRGIPCLRQAQQLNQLLAEYLRAGRVYMHCRRASRHVQAGYGYQEARSTVHAAHQVRETMKPRMCALGAPQTGKQKRYVSTYGQVPLSHTERCIDFSSANGPYGFLSNFWDGTQWTQKQQAADLGRYTPFGLTIDGEEWRSVEH